ncbi:MAG TPA: imidazole glycerol phosphate synthase subunit HisF [Candidatus Eisenbacteria bacterium]|nr:imidazole glycerol phosphate synthase subunit HisF [Candidatus Eisenbacteria bacterium]
MLRCRVIACLDVKDGRVVKGTRFEGLRDVGDPVALAARYEAQGADEVVFLDIAATREGRATLFACVRAAASELRVPLTVGGGIRTADDAALALRAGADKVAVNSAAVESPGLIAAMAERFGAQCVVVSVDARRERDAWRVWTRGGSTPTGLDALAWAETCAARGAGEILLTSIDRDGGRAGYDLALTRSVAERVAVPVVASGGAGAPEHAADAARAGADAVLLAGVLHERLFTIADVKRSLAHAGVPVRSVA